MALEPGSKAPAFDMATHTGGRVSSVGLKDRPFVLYFYPKADTPGCTTEGQDFTALLPEFEAADVTVIGVSRDAVKKLARFAEKRELGVILASDEDGVVTEAYGVWGEKTLYGRVYMGIERATFLIDGDGLIRQAWRKVSVKGHAQAVLDAVAGL